MNLDDIPFSYGDLSGLEHRIPTMRAAVDVQFPVDLLSVFD